MNNNGIIHIFVSSTFNDMQSERDAIMKFVAPRLNDALAKYGKKVIILDLRWGVDTNNIDEEESEKKVLHICFKAIKESRPYFIGLIGGRYGWVPDRKRMDSIIDSLPESDRRIVGEREESKSVTEMEILLGAIGHHDLLRHSIFCFRDESSYTGMDNADLEKYVDRANIHDPTRLASAGRLDSLKRKIASICEKNVECTLMHYSATWNAEEHRFRNLDKFIDNLTNTLLADILKDVREDEVRILSAHEQASMAQQLFVDRLSSDFIGRHRVIGNVLDFVDDIYRGKRLSLSHHGLVIEDVSGSGKSSVYAQLCVKLAEKGYIPLFYSAGISLEPEWFDTMSKYFLQQFGIDKEYTIAQDVSLAITKMLVDGLKPVVLVDSLDNILNIRLSEINKLIPSAVPFIMTTTPGVIGKKVEIDDSIYTTIHLGEYSRTEARELIDSILRRNYKELPDELIYALLEKKTNDGAYACSTPIWIRMAANILLELGDRDFFAMHNIDDDDEGRKIQTYLASIIDSLPPTVEDLFRYTIEVACRYFDPDITRQSLIYIALSHDGLAEETLAQLIGDSWNGLEFKSMRYWMSLYIRENAKGRWQLTHQIFKKVVMNDGDEKLQQCKHRFTEFLLEQLENDNSVDESIADMMVINGDVDLLNRICLDHYSLIPVEGLADVYRREPAALVEFTSKFAATFMDTITYWLPQVVSVLIYNLLESEALATSNTLYDAALSTYSFEDITEGHLQLLQDYICLLDEKIDLYHTYNIEDDDYWRMIDMLEEVFQANKRMRPDELVTIDLTVSFLPNIAKKAKRLEKQTRYQPAFYPQMIESIENLISDCEWYLSGFKHQSIASLRYNHAYYIFFFVFLPNSCLETDDYIRIGKRIHNLIYDFASVAHENYKGDVIKMFREMTEAYARNLSDDTFEHTVITQLYPEIADRYMYKTSRPSNFQPQPIDEDDIGVVSFEDFLSEFDESQGILVDDDDDDDFEDFDIDDVDDDELDSFIEVHETKVAELIENRDTRDTKALQVEIPEDTFTSLVYLVKAYDRKNDDDKTKEWLRLVELFTINAFSNQYNNYTVSSESFERCKVLCGLYVTMCMTDDALRLIRMTSDFALHSMYHHADEPDIPNYLIFCVEFYKDHGYIEDCRNLLSLVGEIAYNHHRERYISHINLMRKDLSSVRFILKRSIDIAIKMQWVELAVHLLDLFYELCMLSYCGSIENDGQDEIDDIYDTLAHLYDESDRLINALRLDKSPLLQQSRIMVVGKNGLYGFIDTDGNVRVPIKYDCAWHQFGNSDYLSVSVDDEWGIVDIDGTPIIPTTLYTLIPSASAPWHGKLDSSSFYILLNNSPVPVKANIKQLGGACAGMLAVLLPVNSAYCKNLLKPDGTTLVLPKNAGTILECGDKIIAETYNKEINNYIYNLYDNKGERLTPDDTYHAIDSADNKLIAASKINSHSCFLNRQGECVIDRYLYVRPFSEGLAAVAYGNAFDDCIWGFIDEDGNEVIPPKYQDVGDFHEGRAWVTPDGKLNFKGGKFFFIDSSGTKTSESYTDISSYHNGIAIVYQNDKILKINLDGEIVG